MELISQGAEAKIFKKKNVLKERFSKSYRHFELDKKIRKLRTRREAKILKKVEGIIPVPKVLDVNEKEGTIELEFVKGKLVKEEFDKNYKKLAPTIGKHFAKLHKNDIIHGDGTTSNMIVGEKIYFIDFGLAFVSKKDEDKAVDLHVLDRAIESKHHKTYPESFDLILTAYKKEYKEGSNVIERLEKVRKRGRNKLK